MARTPKVTVAWCCDCCYWVEPKEIGGHCLSDDCPRTLVKRVGYLCEEPDILWDGPCAMFFQTVKGMKACAHDAY